MMDDSLKKLEKDTKPQPPTATDANRDPLTGEPGAHPVGTGVGATGGALAGAAIGAAAGPIGAAVGLVAGAVAGGLAGKSVAEKIDPTVEDTYWRTHYAEAPYVEKGAAYETYSPAYRLGYQGYEKYRGKAFTDVEGELRTQYEREGGKAHAQWDKARLAARDAWERARQQLEPKKS